MALDGRSAVDPDPELVREYRYYRYRRIHSGLTYRQALDEPRHVIDRDLAFDQMDGEREAEAIKAAQKREQ